MGQGRTVEFGVNLNNREPLIAPGYGMPELLDLSQHVEELGFDSVWVGDSLFSKPRYEPMSLLSAISQRTKDVQARHGLSGQLAAQPAVSRARVGDARHHLGRAHDLRMLRRQPGERRAPRVRGRGARLRPPLRHLRGRASRSCASSGSTAPSPTTARPYDYDDDQLLLGHRDGPADAHPASRRRSGSCPTRGS